MQYHNNEFNNGQVVRISGISYIGGVFHVIIDGVAYMYQEESYDRYHSWVNVFVCGDYDVMPKFKKVDFKAVVSIEDYDMGGYGDTRNITFIKIHGDDMVFRVSAGSCECCGDNEGSMWIGQYVERMVK